ncbi:MAG: SocA family protein [Planctomycetes bacterium]|nr:SocA family protein [Planctomycetota bacterium]
MHRSSHGFPFDAVRAAESAAYVLERIPDHARTRFHVLKLLYLAEREALARYDRPICGGWYVSMPNGPVMSDVYSCMKGEATAPQQRAWDERITALSGGYHLQRRESQLPTRRLSRADAGVLDEIVRLHGAKTYAQLWSFVHDAEHVPEYQAPSGTRKANAIPFDRLLAALGREPHSIRELEAEAAALRRHKGTVTA